jgi:SAM-dependent methyltransferase
VLTVDFDRLGVEKGERVLDLGCGAGRHAYAAVRRGADVVALDFDAAEVATVTATFAAMAEAEEIPAGTRYVAVRGDLRSLPFPDASFDHVVAAEVLEHIVDDELAMAEIARVLRPGGTAAVTVPRWFPERVCWALSSDYHSNPGGHVRIYRGDELRSRLTSVGLDPFGQHHAHSLHVPYWWLKCAVGVHRASGLLAAAPKLYHRLLVWDIVSRPRSTRIADRVLNPVIGKSLVVYVHKPEVARAS